MTDQPAAAAPEVSWAPPPPTGREIDVPGAAGFVFAGTPRRFVAWMADNLLILIGTVVLGTIIASIGGVAMETQSSPLYSILAVVTVALSAVYFVGFWTMGGRATPGMRMFRLQLGTAFDGRPLELVPAIIRWALLGYPLGLVSLVPALANLASTANLLWAIVLLVTVIASPTRQGIHDRVAQSAMVQPAGLGRSGLLVGCLVLVVGLVVLWILSIVFLIFLGSQIEDILREAGQSV